MRVAAVAIVVVLTGCDDADRLPITRPTPLGTRITMMAVPPVVLLSESATTITALVRDDRGTNATGARVTFSASAGTLSTSVATVDDAGMATARLTSSIETDVTVSTDMGSATLRVPAVAPFLVTMTSSATAGLVVPVTGTVSGNPAVVSPPAPVSLRLECGTGGIVPLTAAFGPVLATCVYSSLGTFAPVLIATAANGWSASASAPVTTTPATMTIVGAQHDTTRGDAVWVFDVAPRVSGAAYYRWSYGDGDTSADERVPVRHIYRAAGWKDVRVTAHARDHAVLGDGATQIRVTFTP